MYDIQPSSISHMLAHVSNEEMRQNHPWHVYRRDNPALIGSLAISFTGTHDECIDFVERMKTKKGQSL